MNSYNKEDIEKIANKFEEKYGVDCLVKVIFTSLTKLMVEKGIITIDELYEKFLIEIPRAMKELNAPDKQ